MGRTMIGLSIYNKNILKSKIDSDLDRLRLETAYPGTDVLLICFSTINPDSYSHVKEWWIPEIRKHCCRHTPFLLVGTQIDLKTHPVVIANLGKGRPLAQKWMFFWKTSKRP